jgi:hypothetical protein
LVPWLAVLPAINVAVVLKPGNARAWMPPGVAAAPIPAPDHPQLIWLCLPLMIVLVLSYGAAVTSFGLACATWIRRQGRAIATSVVGYALVTVGWLALIGVARTGRDVEWLMIASPFFGPGDLAAQSGMLYGRSANGLPEHFDATGLWAGVYAVGAMLLYGAVLLSFNRCLGRMPERGRVPPRGAARRWAPPRGETKSVFLPVARPPEDVAAPLVVEPPGQDEQ